MCVWLCRGLGAGIWALAVPWSGCQSLSRWSVQLGVVPAVTTAMVGNNTDVLLVTGVQCGTCPIVGGATADFTADLGGVERAWGACHFLAMAFGEITSSLCTSASSSVKWAHLPVSGTAMGEPELRAQPPAGSG